MKNISRISSLLTVLLLALSFPSLRADEKSCDQCACPDCKGKSACCCHDEKPADAGKKSADAERHPLKGVIVDVYAAKGALMVKHEEIPGYMMAMTMLFKVDEVTLRTAKKGDAITATLVERDGEYYLEDVKPAAR
ncbi:MAG: copper-binding protein [Opitutae bacterium]|nr:copper-binding protein [Opitutae bacterium]